MYITNTPEVIPNPKSVNTYNYEYSLKSLRYRIAYAIRLVDYGNFNAACTILRIANIDQAAAVGFASRD